VPQTGSHHGHAQKLKQLQAGRHETAAASRMPSRSPRDQHQATCRAPAGSRAVAWCLIAVVNVRHSAGGCRSCLPAAIASASGVAMVAALFAALIPVLKLARMQPASLERFSPMNDNIRISRRAFAGGALVVALGCRLRLRRALRAGHERARIAPVTPARRLHFGRSCPNRTTGRVVYVTANLVDSAGVAYGAQWTCSVRRLAPGAQQEDGQ